MSLEKVKELTNSIGKKIAERVDKDNPDAISFRLEELVALQASASYCMSLAQMVYNEKLAALVQEDQFSKLSATDKKMVFAGRAKWEIFYMDLSERQAKNISYGIEAMRTLLSFLKSERTNAQYAGV